MAHRLDRHTHTHTRQCTSSDWFVRRELSFNSMCQSNSTYIIFVCHTNTKHSHWQYVGKGRILCVTWVRAVAVLYLLAFNPISCTCLTRRPNEGDRRSNDTSIFYRVKQTWTSFCVMYDARMLCDVWLLVCVEVRHTYWNRTTRSTPSKQTTIEQKRKSTSISE